MLLDPAVGLDGQWMREIAEAMMAAPDYTDPAEARTEKSTGAWADVPPAELDAEVRGAPGGPTGRYRWRVCLPAMMSYWSELARDIAVPHRGTPTTLVRAAFSDPQYVTETLIETLSGQLGADFTLTEFGCRHMVPMADPPRPPPSSRDLLGWCPRSPAPRSSRCAPWSPRSRRDGSPPMGHRLCGRAFQPRIVGWIMRTDAVDLPWHRVITASGRPARIWPHVSWNCCAPKVLAADGRVALSGERSVRHQFG